MITSPLKYVEFKVTITNEAPYFKAEFVDQVIQFNKTTIYKIPEYVDPEAMKLNVYRDAFPSIGNEFISVSGN